MYKCKIVLMPDVFYRVFKILHKDDDDDAIIIIIIIICYCQIFYGFSYFLSSL